MIKSHKNHINHKISKAHIDNFSGAGGQMGKRGLRFQARSMIDKKFAPESFPESYDLRIQSKAPPASKHSAMSDEKFNTVRFKEYQNPDLAGKAVRGKNLTRTEMTSFRNKKVLKYNPLVEKQYARAENSMKQSGGDPSRSYMSETKATRAMEGKGVRIGRKVKTTRALENLLDVEYAEDRYRKDLIDDHGQHTYEQMRIKTGK